MRTGSSSKLLDASGAIINPASEEGLTAILNAITASTSGVKTTITVANVAMANANTEYNYALPANTKGFVIKLRAQSALLKLSFTSGQSGTTYVTIPQNDRYNSFDYNVDLDSKTIYFQSPSASQIAEIFVFT